MVKVALLVGVSEYQSGFHPLPLAKRDVEEMQIVLQNREMDGFDPIKLLIDPDSQTIRVEIEELFTGRSKEDLVLLFFSGHGIKDDWGNLYFAARDTRKTPTGELMRSTAVGARFIQELMGNSRCRRQVVILDCCFSGAFAAGMAAKDSGSIDIETQLGGEGRAVLTSSNSTQYSFEEQTSDLSIYTSYIVEGLKTGAADLNHDGWIEVDELHEYAKDKVQETAPAMKPEIYAVKEGFKIRLTRAPVIDPKLIYRQRAERLIRGGELSRFQRMILDSLRVQLKVSVEDAMQIQDELLQPYREHMENCQRYREVLEAAVESEYPLSEQTRSDLRYFQDSLGLQDRDIAPIEAEVLNARESTLIHVDNFKAFQSAIARIYCPNVERPNEGVVGAGLLISKQYVLTCAHVVTSAIGIAPVTPETPTQSIDVDFPLIAPGEKLKAKVVFWKPVQSVTASSSQKGEDIAVLELEGELSQQVQPVKIAPIEDEDLWEHSIRIFGFPSRHEAGVWATGVLRGIQALGWIQIEDIKSYGYRVGPGFSGAPVWDKNLASIVGITVAAEREEEVKAAFMIPIKVLKEQIPDNFFFLPDRVIALPTVDEDYQPIIRAFTSGDIVPFLGDGINLCDRPRGMPIELALRLAQVYDPHGQLQGETYPTYPLSNEQRLALAKRNLRFISQYVSSIEDDLYEALHFHLNKTYDELLQDKTNLHRLHEFLAHLPNKMMQKGSRQLPCKLIVTTNYDEILEQVFDRVGQPYDVVFYVAEGDDRGTFKHKTHKGQVKAIPFNADYQLPWGQHPIILKLFGTWQHEFVITEDNYTDYLVGIHIDQVLPAKLLNILQNSKILFLGYSLNDPDLKLILHRFWQNMPLKRSRGLQSWIVHQSEPGNLETQFWQDRQVDLIKSSLEDFITNLEMGIERLESRLT